MSRNGRKAVTVGLAADRLKMTGQKGIKMKVYIPVYENGRRAPRVKLVSVNNGESYCTPEEAVESVEWDALVSLMDDRTREAVAAEWDGDEDDHAGFLRAYLALAPSDLIIG